MKEKIIQIHGLDEVIGKIRRKYLNAERSIFYSLEDLTLEDLKTEYENALIVKKAVEKISKVEIENGLKVYKVKMCALETYFNLYNLLCSLGYEVEIVALDSLWLN